MPIGSLIASHIGGGWGKEEPVGDESAPASVIRGTDIPHAVVGNVSTLPFRFHKPSALKSRLLEPGDLIFEVSGGSKDQPVGRTLIVTPELLDRIGAPTICASFCKRVSVDRSLADPRFVEYAIRAAYRDRTLATFQVQSTGISNFQWKAFLKDFRVPCPDVGTQVRVADVLDAFDDLIRNNRRRIEILEETARSLYREWFVWYRFPGHESVEFVDSELGPVPSGWDVLPLATAVGLNPKVDIARGQAVAFLSMSDVSPESMGAQPSQVRSWSGSGARFLNGDTLFARITPSLEHGKTAFVQFLEDGEPGAGSTEFIVMRGRRLGPEHTYLLARDERIRSHAIASMSGASGRQRVRLSCFDSLLIVVPPSDVAAGFAGRARPLFRAVAVLESLSSVLANTREALLPKLVTGQIDVDSLGVDDVYGWEEAASA